MPEIDPLDPQALTERMNARLADLYAILPRVAHRPGARTWVAKGQNRERTKKRSPFFLWLTAQAESLEDLQRGIDAVDKNYFIVRTAFDMARLQKFDTLLRGLFARRNEITKAQSRDDDGCVVWPFIPAEAKYDRPIPPHLACPRRCYLVVAKRLFRKGYEARVVMAREEEDACASALFAWFLRGIFFIKIEFCLNARDFRGLKSKILAVEQGDTPNFLWPLATDDELKDSRLRTRKFIEDAHRKTRENHPELFPALFADSQPK